MLPAFLHFLDICRALGVRQALRLAPQWIVRPRFLVLLRVFDDKPPAIARDEIIQWSTLKADDTSCLSSLNPALSEDEIRRRLAEGQECELAFVGEDLVHYIWRTTKPVYLPYLRRTYLPSPGEIFVMEVFTPPAFRRHGIYIQSIARTGARARQSGLRRQSSHVAWWNTPVLHTANKTGAQVVGTVGYWNLGFHRHYFATGRVSLKDDCVVLA